MSSSTKSMVRPIDASGNELINVDELAERTGYSEWRIRELVRGSRGGVKITGIKLGRSWWFNWDTVRKELYGHINTTELANNFHLAAQAKHNEDDEVDYI